MKRAGYIRAGVAAYVIVGLGTFGHSAAQHQRSADAEYTACKKADPKGFCWHETTVAPAGGLGAALLWPLYWSWELQQ